MSQVKFGSNQEALTFYKNEVIRIEKETGRDFEDLTLESENSMEHCEMLSEVASVQRHLKMCNHLVKKGV